MRLGSWKKGTPQQSTLITELALTRCALTYCHESEWFEHLANATQRGSHAYIRPSVGMPSNMDIRPRVNAAHQANIRPKLKPKAMTYRPFEDSACVQAHALLSMGHSRAKL